MKVLVVQMFGLGNACMSTPLIQALASQGHEVDVLVEQGRAAHLALEGWAPTVQALYVGATPATASYTKAFYCHAMRYYQARVQAFRHHEINLPKDQQFMWSFPKHEIEVLMDLARDHTGYTGEIPLPRKLPRRSVGIAAEQHPHGHVAISVGYFKGAGREQWAKKHWGTQNYTDLCTRLDRAGFLPVIVGGIEDADDAREISAACPAVVELCGKCTFPQTCDVLATARAFIGNDSGLMHVAAAYEIPTLGIFLISNPKKNAPWGPNGVVLQSPSPDQAWDAFLARVENAAQ